MLRLSAVLFIAILISSCATTQIYIVRHAEKQVQDPNVMMLPNDVELSAEGHARANRLADSLNETTLEGIFATTIRRTQQTVEPTANRKELPVILYAPTQSAANTLIDSLVRIKKKNFLVAGHSNTVPNMIRHLGLSLSFEGDIPDTVYNKMFVVKVNSSGAVSVQEKIFR